MQNPLPGLETFLHDTKNGTPARLFSYAFAIGFGFGTGILAATQLFDVIPRAIP